MSLDFLKGGGGDTARSSASGGSSARTGTARSGYDSARSDGSTARTSGGNIFEPGKKKKKKGTGEAGEGGKGAGPKSNGIMMDREDDEEEETEVSKAAISVRRRLQLYNKMMTKAGFGKAVSKHMSHISNMNGSTGACGFPPHLSTSRLRAAEWAPTHNPPPTAHRPTTHHLITHHLSISQSCLLGACRLRSSSRFMVLARSTGSADPYTTGARTTSSCCPILRAALRRRMAKRATQRGM